MISDRLLALVRCPECHGDARARLGDALTCQGCGRALPRGRRATTSTCGRGSSSPSRRSTWTRRCTPTRGTSACRRRCSARGSATTCCARSSRPRPAIASSISAAAAAARCCGTATGGAATIGIDISPFFAQEARAGRRSAARRPAPAAVRRRHLHQGLLARRARAPVARGAARRCWPRRRACSRRAARCSSTRTSARTRRSPSGLRWINALARGLERVGLIDMRQERLRKSDHLNPLARRPGARAGRARRRLPHRADPLLHADRRRLRREHPDAHGRARAWRSARRLARIGVAAARRAAAATDASALREARASRARPAIAAQRARSYACCGALVGRDEARPRCCSAGSRSGPFFALLEDGTPSARAPSRDRRLAMRILYSAIDQTVPGTNGRIGARRGRRRGARGARARGARRS